MNREALKKSLIRHEGIRYKAYKDSEGFWTIGVGHKLPAYTPRVMTLEEVMTQLDADIDEAEAGARNFDWYYTLSGVRQAVIVEMVFQLGFYGVSKFKNMILAIIDKDFNKAADEMKDSKWYRQTPKRCDELSEIMRRG